MSDNHNHEKQNHSSHCGHSRTVLHNILGENTELYFAMISGVFWLIGLVLSLTSYFNVEELPKIMFILATIFGGVFTTYEAVTELAKGRFEIDFLMLVAAVGAILLDRWGESALLLFLFSLGHSLEHYAMRKARKSIASLADLTPPTALLKKGTDLLEVPIENLEIGNTIVVRPNSKIPADGVVIKGSSSINQASITGESMPVKKQAYKNSISNINFDTLDANVKAYSGTINGSGVIEIKVLKLANDSTLSKLIHLVKEAETQKSPTQRLTDKFEKYYVPSVIIVVFLLNFAYLVIDETFKDSFYRAMSVLISASPCALAISTPSAVLAAISRAAKKGILFKGGRPLEDLGKVNTIAFDKTGTLTEGKPKLTHVIPFGSTTKEELLTTSLAVEYLSDHPIAKSIVEGAKRQLNLASIPKASNLKALTSRGIKAEFKNELVYIGNRRLLVEVTNQPIPKDIDSQMNSLEQQGNTAMIVYKGEKYMGIIAVMDIARPEVIDTLVKLKKLGISKMIMLTGDHQKVANTIAEEIGITDALGNLLPEDKVISIKELKKSGRVAMVGDGVNDAPAMANSTVGIAMGAAGSDTALETADVALMADKISNLPFAIQLSRAANITIKQNLVLSLSMVAILVPLTLFDKLGLSLAVIGHEGMTILVVINALRLLNFKA